MATFAELEAQFEAIKADVAKFENGNKAAGARARKGLLALERASKAWRAASLKA